MTHLQCNCLVAQAIKDLVADNKGVTIGPTARLLHEGLLSHVVVGAIVVWNLAMINLARDPDSLWFVWPLAGWVGAVLLHTASVVWKTERDRQQEETLGLGVGHP